MNATPDMVQTNLSPLQSAIAIVTKAEEKKIEETAPVADPIDPNLPVKEVKEDPKEEKPKEDLSAKRFEELTKLDRKNRRERQEIEQAKKLVAEDRAKHQKILDAFSKAKDDPFALMEAAGLTYEELIAKGLQNDPSKKGMTALEQEVLELKKELNEWKNGRELEKQETTINLFKRDIDAHIQKDASLQVTKTFGSAEIVYNVVEEYYRTHDKILSIEEACKMVEEGLSAQVKETYEKIRSSNLPFLGNSPKPSETPAPVSQQSTKTLTNTAFVSPNRGGIDDDSKEARLKRAMAAISG